METARATNQDLPEWHPALDAQTMADTCNYWGPKIEMTLDKTSFYRAMNNNATTPLAVSLGDQVVFIANGYGMTNIESMNRFSGKKIIRPFLILMLLMKYLHGKSIHVAQIKQTVGVEWAFLRTTRPHLLEPLKIRYFPALYVAANARSRADNYFPDIGN